ncbi:uncharacterized protein LOC131892878 isoform X2 [Tigriopus californicus]|nr:uncharacterized protein LOC131892878 isoform X2 [Tigriopus californicus]
MSRNSNPKEHESKTKRRNRKPINRCACAASLNIRKIRLCYCENPESNPFCEKFQTQFQLLGCLTHSHRPQKQFLRIPKVKRDMLLSLMEIGVPKKVILDKYCSSENLDETEGKIVTLKDLDNFEKHHRKFRKTSGPPRLQKVPCQECKLSQPNSCPHDPMVVLTLDKFSNEDHDYCSTNVMIPVPKLDDKSNQSDRNHQFEPTDIEAVETESSAHKDFELRKTRILKELDSHLGQVGAARGEKLLHKLSDINGEAKAFLTERAKRPKSQGREEHGHPEPLNLLNEDAVRILLDNPFVVNEMIEPVEDQYA